MNINFIITGFISVIAVVLFCSFLTLLKKNKKIKTEYENRLKLVTNTINSVRYGNLAARLAFDNDDLYPNLTRSINRMVETIQDREKMIGEFKKEITSHNIFLETLINSLSDGFIILDENFVIKKMTQVAQLLLGNAAQGKNISDFFDFDFPGNISSPVSFQLSLKNNPEIILSVTISNLKFDYEVVFKYLVTIKDISKESELTQIKNDFVATLAHDLRVPLLAEGNALKLLKKGNFGQLNEATSQVVDMLLQSNSDTVLLTDILLETYKLEQTKLVLNLQKCNINSLIKEVCHELVGVLTVKSFNINFNLCEDFETDIDSFQFKRVLRNIIKNSIDYSSETSDKIDIYTYVDDKNFAIKIRDYGCGISEDDKDKIFQKFYSGAHKFRKVGSGLGLYLANEIVKAHGGKIIITSEPNVQTDFEISIPFHGC